MLILELIFFTKLPASLHDWSVLENFITVGFILVGLNIIGAEIGRGGNNLPGITSTYPTPKTPEDRKYLFRDDGNEKVEEAKDQKSGGKHKNKKHK